MQIRPANPDDAWSIAAVDVASWQAAYRGLMLDAYLDALSVPRRATDWQRRLLGADAERGRRTFAALRDMGFTAATLGVLEANERARRLYERLGWRTDGVSQSDIYGGRELPVLRYTRSLGADPADADGDGQ